MIPVIQRDYAQGRDKYQNIRSEFLDNIAECLNKDEGKLRLDFIYGYRDRNSFVPLDGQQRLTTLYLLHFYFMSEACISLTKDSFRYNTRITSGQFCELLFKNSGSLKRDGKLHDQIIDSPWFSNSWLYDPTIKGMLVMLDTIDQHFYKTDKEKLYKRLFENECIEFLIKDISDEENILAYDDLYIKMNARGRLLSEFENFKSFIDNKVQTLAKSDVLSADFYLSWKNSIDTEWTDLFWKYRNKGDKNPEDIGDEFMRFFKGMLLNHLAIQGKDNFCTNIDTTILNDPTIIDYFSLTKEFKNEKLAANHMYDQLLEKLLNDKIIFNSIYKKLDLFNKELLEEISSSLNNITKNYGEVKEIISVDLINFNIDSQISEKEKRRPIIQTIITGNVTYQNRLLFHTITKLCESVPEPFETIQRLRVVRNLIENREYNQIDEYRSGLIEINNLLSGNNPILEKLADENYNLKHFESVQIQEERRKAKVILTDDSHLWWKAILIAENDTFLLGQISCLLDFAEVFEPVMLTDEKFTLFNKYFENAVRVISNDTYKANDLIQKALLCFGDYTLDFSGGRKCLLTINKHRDTSFKKLLISSKKGLFKDLLDALNDHDINDIIKSKLASGEIWQQLLIENQELIQKLGNYKLIEFYVKSGDDNKKKVINLVTGNNNGYKFAELITLDLFYRIRTDTNLMPIDLSTWQLNYWESTDHRDSPCIFITHLPTRTTFQIAIDIHYEYYAKDHQEYRISIFSRVGSPEISKGIIENEFIKEIAGFNWASFDGYNRYEFFCDSESECREKLSELVEIKVNSELVSNMTT